MSYLGDDASTPNVVGQGTHISWAGFGITGGSYAQVYEAARPEAVSATQRHGESSEPGFLYNIKVFREIKSWPQIVASGLLITGIAAAADGAPGVGAIFALGAGALFPLQIYDMWIVADYTDAPEAE